MIRWIALGLLWFTVAGCGGASESTQETLDTTEPTPTTVQATPPATSSVEPTDTDSTLPPDTTTTGVVAQNGGESEEASLRSAVSRYVSAFGEGDPDAAVSLLSERCADTVPISEYRAAVASAGELYPGLVIGEFSDIVLGEDAAVVYYTTDPVIEADQGERWAFDSGTWRWDDC